MTTITDRQPKQKLWSRSFISALLANALVFLGFEMMAPTLPLYVSSIGGEATQIGLVTGIFVISAILIRPFTGVMAMKMDKKYLLVIGVTIGALATGSYYLATEVWALVLVRILHGFGFGITTTYFTTIAAENTPGERLGEGIGYFGVGETTMVSIGPLIGVMILEIWDFKGLFLSGMAFMLLALLVTLFISRKPNDSRGSEQKATPSIQFKLIEKRVLFQSMLSALIGISAGGIMSFIALFAVEKGLAQTAMFFTVVALAGLVVRIFSGRIYDHSGPIYVLIPFGLVTLAGLVLLVFVQNDRQFLIAAFLYGLGFGAIFPALQSWCISLVDEHEHENAVASFFNFFDIGIGVGAMALGVLAQVFDTYAAVFYVSIGAYALFLLLCVFYAKKLLAYVKERSF
ncbi:MFS transporter [uncultured Trichococcus sp.]|uniref:MFS transporter n=1 Tax=uncultured Trichococcus sp. TaxID=189665 RepID=UPI0029C8282A|nr:MFS transporter [uncultured Trichococcus sp.]